MEEYIVASLVTNVDVIGIVQDQNDLIITLKDPMILKYEELIPNQPPMALMQRFLLYSEEKVVVFNKQSIITMVHPISVVRELYKKFVSYSYDHVDKEIIKEFEYSMKFVDSIKENSNVNVVSTKHKWMM